MSGHEVWDADAYVGTCDAGNCDRLTDAIVLTADGWLSMCKRHAVEQFESVCCHLHGLNCEPPSELCCSDCTEACHGWHVHGDGLIMQSHHDGSACVLYA